jgi:hypothetical protein
MTEIYVIHKLALNDGQFFQGMPLGWKPLHVGYKSESFGNKSHGALWYKVPIKSLNGPTRKYGFTIVGTGEAYPEDQVGDYMGTFIAGSFVWHLFAKELEGE